MVLTRRTSRPLFSSGITTSALSTVGQVVFAVAVITVAVYWWYSQPVAAILTNADELQIPAFYDEILRGLGEYSNWHFGADHSFVPDFALYAVLRFLTGSFTLALGLFGLVQCVSLFVIARSIYMAVGGRNGWTFTILALLGYTLVLLYGSAHDPSLLWSLYFYPLTSEIHFGTYAVSMMALLLCLWDQREKKFNHGRWTLLLVFLSILSDLLFVVYFAIPVLAISFVLSFTSEGHRGFYRRGFFVLLPVTVVSVLASRAITPSTSLYTSKITVAAVRQSAGVFIDNVHGLYSADPYFFSAVVFVPIFCMIAVAVASLVPALVSYLWPQVKSTILPILNLLKFDDRGQGAVIAYAAMSTWLCLVAVLGLCLYADLATMRYLGPLLFTPGLLTVMVASLVMENWGQSWNGAGGWLLRFGVLAAIGGLALSGPPDGMTKAFAAPAYVSCFSGMQPAAGLAGYWEAKPLIMYSEHRLQVAAIIGHGEPFLWVDSDRWYVDSWTNPGRPPNFSFIYLKELDPDSILARYGKPSRVTTCDGSALWLYDQPNDLYSHLVSGNAELEQLAAARR